MHTDDDHEATHVVQIPPYMIGEMFPHIALHLIAGLHNIGMSLDEAIGSVLGGRAQLWSVLRDNHIDAAFMTELLIEDGKTVVAVFALGGRGLPRFAAALDAAMMRFAMSQNASRIRFAGREGWLRVLPAYTITGRHEQGHAIFERRVTQ